MIQLRMHRILMIAAALLLPRVVLAQDVTIDPNGEQPTAADDSDEGGSANAPASDSDGAMANRPYATAPGGAQRNPAAPAQRSDDDATSSGGGYYHNDDADNEAEGDLATGGSGATAGQVPAVHVVRSGDTLWDLCTYYFSSPWEWPRVWSYNPEVTNPHWIYPGNQLRLRAPGDGTVAAPDASKPGANQGEAVASAVPSRHVDPSGFELRQVAFVDLDDLRFGGRVDGSPEEKSLLASGDEAYIAYPAGQPPKIGQRLSIYQKRRDVVHPETGNVIGAYVNVVGELEILSVKKDKRARAVITDSVQPIERGDRVGPLRQRFATVAPTAATIDLQATIVDLLGSDLLIGARQVVFLDRGKSDGLAPGNRLYAVRRGDAYSTVMGPNSNVGKDDHRFPARALGELLVVEVGKHTSLAVVTVAVQELEIGDHVVLSRAAN